MDPELRIFEQANSFFIHAPVKRLEIQKRPSQALSQKDQATQTKKKAKKGCNAHLVPPGDRTYWSGATGSSETPQRFTLWRPPTPTAPRLLAAKPKAKAKHAPWVRCEQTNDQSRLTDEMRGSPADRRRRRSRTFGRPCPPRREPASQSRRGHRAKAERGQPADQCDSAFAHDSSRVRAHIKNDSIWR